jgi:hypothetical protein
MDEKQSNGKGWVPPRVKELQRETTKHKCADWTAICNSVDENGRTLLHYVRLYAEVEYVWAQD